jgi:hypothetical protein
MREGSFATKGRPLKEMRGLGYKVNTRAWTVERSPKWATEDTDQFYYESNARKLTKTLGENPSDSDGRVSTV